MGTSTENRYSIEHYAYVNGQQIGGVNEHGDIDVLSGVTGFSNSEAGSSNYVAQDGDTMQSIAQAVYGDASLWYVVADANGFDAATDAPAAGQTLKLPQVTTNSNTAETFKPYNPREISGSTTPSLPQAPQPPPSADHCKANLALIVVAVVVAVLVPEIAPVLAEAWGGGTLATIGAYAVAGVAADTAGQVAADSLSLRNGYSWKEAEVAGITAGVTAGVSEGLTAEGGVFVDGAGNLSTAGEAVVGAAQYAGTYAGEKLVGLPAHFSWAGLVANAAGAAAAHASGFPTDADLQQGTLAGFGDAFAGRVIQGAVTRETSLVLGDNHVQGWQEIVDDAFGNALGNAAIAGIQTENARSQAQQQARLEATAQQMESNFSGELQGDIDAQTGQYIQSQMDAASEADFALMDAERGVIVNDIGKYGTGFLGPQFAAMSNRSSAVNTPMTQVSQSTPAEAGTPGFGTPNDVAYYDQNGVLNIPIVAHNTPEPSMLDQIDARLSNFNSIVNDELVDEGAQALRDNDQAAFVRNGLKYAFYNTFMPDSVQQAAVGVVGGTVLGKGLGLVAKEATTLFPVLGRGVGDLASSASRPIGDLLKNFGGGSKATNVAFVSNSNAIGATNEAGMFDYLWDQINTVADFSTPPNRAAFYTAFETNYPRASDWALFKDGYTIDSTPGGSWLTEMTYGPQAQLSRSQVDLLWEAASAKYAAGASGDVHIFTGGLPRDESKVLYRVELPILQNNPNVNLIWH